MQERDTSNVPFYIHWLDDAKLSFIFEHFEMVRSSSAFNAINAAAFKTYKNKMPYREHDINFFVKLAQSSP